MTEPVKVSHELLETTLLALAAALVVLVKKSW